MLTQEQVFQFNNILNELGNNLDISETDYKNAVSSYNAVGNWLCSQNSELYPYNAEVLPQGSFILGTMVKPINPKDDLDIDLICQLSDKRTEWTQYDVKNLVGRRLKSNETYRNMLDEEGRRCWTLKYRENSINFDKYHMDILPAIVGPNYGKILERSFSRFDNVYSDLFIRITDKHLPNYYSDTNTMNWLLSNPFGYAKWFFSRANLTGTDMYSLKDAVGKFPKYQKQRLPLQRVVQILKRHRDIMFKGDCDKPISIIITTLAAHSYNKEQDIVYALLNVVQKMRTFIETKYDQFGKEYKCVLNPANMQENFADKWKTNPKKEGNFYKWLDAVEIDIQRIIQKRGPMIAEEMSRSLGENEVTQTFKNIGNNIRTMTENGKTTFNPSVGIGSSGTSLVKPHTFFGDK